VTAPRHAYEVRRSTRARRARLTVTEGGAVVVVLPRRAAPETAERLVREHESWLDRHVGRLQAEQARLQARPALGLGRTLSLDGWPVAVHIVVTSRQRGHPRVELAGGRLIVRVAAADDVPAALERWLRARARDRLRERVEARAPEIGVQPGRLTIRDQRSRWASASARGDLSFSWRLVLAPPFVLDAVVVHELAHLRIRGHSRAFWSLVERHAPRTPEARRWLRQHAREVRAALD
jgi:predicted metal-dependent hydrolase